ncbi:MAG: DUF3291 domain-containing protein [Arenicellales bacterium]
MAFHLAQVNIAQAKGSMDSVVMKGFADRLDDINALADAAPGFVWRLQTDAGDATSIQAFDDPNLLVNMSVWADIESLKNYVYRSLHVELIQDRDAWFSKTVKMHQALWWVPAGHIPSVDEAKDRLEYLQQHGPSAQAFTFSKPFEPA